MLDAGADGIASDAGFGDAKLDGTDIIDCNTGEPQDVAMSESDDLADLADAASDDAPLDIACPGDASTDLDDAATDGSAITSPRDADSIPVLDAAPDPDASDGLGWGDDAAPAGDAEATFDAALTPDAAPPPSEPLTLFASPGGSGSDCTQSQPCSLTGARGKVRTLNADMTTDIVVRLSDGVYTLTETFELADQGDVSDSGTHGHTISYQAEPGARPILSGGLRITGWSLFDAARGIYRAPVPATLRTRQLYVGGARAVRARSRLDVPGYLRSPGVNGTPGFFNNDVASDIPDGSWKTPTQLEVASRVEWKAFRCPLESADRRLHYWVAASSGTSIADAQHWFLDENEGPLYIGDFDGDGKADLLKIVGTGTETCHSHVSLSTGSAFASSSLFDGLVPCAIDPIYRVGDFDGDGRADLLVAHGDDLGAWHNDVILSTGNGFGFTTATDWMPGIGQGADYQVGDFDGNGKTDILFAYRDGPGNQHNDVALSDGSGFRWTSTTDWLPGIGQDRTYRVGNFDGDEGKKSDLLFTYRDTNGVWHHEVAVSKGTRFEMTSPAEWLQNSGQDALYAVGNLDADANGTSDLLVFSPDGQGDWHHRLGLSNGHAFTLGVASGNAANVVRSLTPYTGNFDGAGGSAEILLVGRQTWLQVKEPCWTHTHPTNNPNMNAVSWIENAYELLDAPGEWFLDESAPCPTESTRCIYYLPRSGEDLATLPVVVAQLDTLVRGHGDKSAQPTPRYLHDVRFDGLTFAFATWLEPSGGAGFPEIQAGWHGDMQTPWKRTPGSVSFSSAKRITIKNSTFTHLGAVGLDFDSGSQDNLLDGNVFTDISSSGIQIGAIDDFGVDASRGTAGNTISNTFVSRTGTEYESSVGIWIGYARDTMVRNNEIANLPYTGLSLGWGWGQDSYARNNQIVANFVHDVMSTLHDGGSIYTLSAQPASRLQRNHLRGSTDYAIYHDQGSSYFTDAGNFIAQVKRWLALGAGDRSNEMLDNWIDFDRFACGYGSATTSAEQCSWDGNHAAGNLFFGDGTWPVEAQQVIDSAGLEPQYRAIRDPKCGDATCSASETPASCPKDCL